MFVDNIEHKGPITITRNIVIENTLTTKCDKIVHVTPPTPPVIILPPIELKKYTPTPAQVHLDPPPKEILSFTVYHRFAYQDLKARYLTDKNPKINIHNYREIA